MRIRVRAEGNRRAVHLVLPLGGVVDAREDLHQRALARAVVADQRGDLAGVGIEVHAAKGLHMPKTLDDPARPEDRLALSRWCRLGSLHGRRLPWRGLLQRQTRPASVVAL